MCYYEIMKKLLLILLGIIVIGVVAWLTIPLFTEKEVNEELPFDTTTPQTTLPTEDTKNPEVILEESPFEAPDSMSPQTGPMVLGSGSFTDADSFHKASGMATIYENNGERYIELRDFEVTNGPDLFVYLSPHPMPRSKPEFGEAVNIEQLKGNKGNQVYAIPSDIDVDNYQSVVIYCRAFSTIFGTAELK